MKQTGSLPPEQQSIIAQIAATMAIEDMPLTERNLSVSLHHITLTLMRCILSGKVMAERKENSRENSV